MAGVARLTPIDTNIVRTQSYGKRYPFVQITIHAKAKYIFELRNEHKLRNIGKDLTNMPK